MARTTKSGQDVEKERFWAKTIKEAVRSGASIREFCTRHKLNEGQFYWWKRKLEGLRQERTLGKQRRKATSGVGGEPTFALVNGESGEVDSGIELVFADGRKLRIGRGVDEDTLRMVLETMEQ